MQTAKNSHACVSAALNGLMAEAFMRTQKEWLEKHPDADMDSAIAEFREALSAYGRGEKFVQKALEDAGFISPTPGSNEMALLSFAGQQAAMMEERGTKYSIQTLPDGTQYVMVDTDQHIFDGVDESEYKKIARDYIKQRFSGKYLGPNADVYVTKRSAEEYAFPVNRRMDREIKRINTRRQRNWIIYYLFLNMNGAKQMMGTIRTQQADGKSIKRCIKLRIDFIQEKQK